MNKKISFAARLALLTATIIWGATFVILKNTIDSIPFELVLAVRFTIGFLLLCVVFAGRLKSLSREYFKEGALIGLFLFLAYYVQTLGLQYTTPGKNAFLTAVYCVIVPFLAWAVSKKRPDRYNIIAAVVTVAGVGLVSFEGDFSMGFGEICTLLGGFFFAAHIVAVSRLSKNRDPILVTVMQFLFSAIYCWLVTFATADMSFEFSRSAVFGILYLGIFGTGVALLLQNIGQKYTNPSAASVILSLESVFGVLFSVVFAREALTFRAVAGFALIFAAIIISETKLKLLKK